MKTLNNLYRGLLLITVMLSVSCVKKFFPENALYQYPQKTNDIAVVYPDGSVHHSDDTISSAEKNNSTIKIPEPITTGSTDVTAAPTIHTSSNSKKETTNTSSIKDATGRHARHRGDK